MIGCFLIAIAVRKPPSPLMASRAAINSPGIVMELLFGFSPFIAAGVAAYYPSVIPLTRNPRIWGFVTLALLALLFLAVYLGGWLALRGLDPASYARITISGRPVGITLRTVSIHGRRVIREFRLANRWGFRLRNKIDRVYEESKKAFWPERVSEVWKKSQVESVIHLLTRLEERQHTQLERLEHMKAMAASELGIPTRRFCDHVCQYSPAIQRALSRKVRRNWEEQFTILHDLSTGRHHFDRFTVLFHQTQDILSAFKTRYHLLGRLRNYRDLHSYLRDLAAMPSTSASLHTYSRSLARAVNPEVVLWKPSSWVVGAGFFLYRLGGGADEPDAWLRKRLRSLGSRWVCSRLWERLRFMRRKQRVHAGCDLSYLLSRLSDSFPTIGDEDMREVAESVKWVLKELEPRHPTVYPDRFKVTHHVQSLSHLPTFVSISIENHRGPLVLRFDETLDGFFGGRQNFILTQGFSRTVRDILTRDRAAIPGHAFEQAGVNGPADSTESATSAGRAAPDDSNPTATKASDPEPIHVVLLLDDDDALNLENRLMEYNLRGRKQGIDHAGDDQVYLVAGTAIGTITAADPRLIIPMVEPGDAVLILLGGECFDLRGRILQPQGFSALEDTKREIQDRGAKCAFYLVAESYKQVTDLGTTGIVFNDHLDRVRISRPDQLDGIITDIETHGRPW